MQAASNEQDLVVGIDVGGTQVALLATDIATGEDLARDRVPTPAEAGPDALIEMLCQSVYALVERAGRERDQLCALGIAVPGQVDVEHGRVIVAGNLDGRKNGPLGERISEQFGVPVFVDQDANAAALGERWRGCAKEMNNFVFVALGTELGAGLVVNGRLHRGYHHAAGEVGNLLMGRGYLGQERGQHGNLELLVGSPAIRDQARNASGRELDAADALEQAEEDARLARVADRVVDFVAMAVINITSLLDPEAIIFGGGTSSAGEDLLEPVRQRVARELAVVPTLHHSALGGDAQVHGAVFDALWRLNPELARREELRLHASSHWVLAAPASATTPSIVSKSTSTSSQGEPRFGGMPE